TFTLTQGTTVVAGTVSYTNGTAIFTPADNLAPLTTFTATISTRVKDLAGNPLTTDISWSFTTGVAPDTTAPVHAGGKAPAYVSRQRIAGEVLDPGADRGCEGGQGPRRQSADD